MKRHFLIFTLLLLISGGMYGQTTSRGLSVTPDMLSFTYNYGDGPSEVKTFKVLGRDLTDAVSITVPEWFEISNESTGIYSNNLTFNPEGGDLPETIIYVRMVAGLDVDEYNDNATVACGEHNKTVTLNGIVNGTIVETPTFSPVGGTYTDSLTVVISCATDSATIHYTLDGSEPTESDSLYFEPLLIEQTTTVQAKAWKDGCQPSSIASETYTIEIPKLNVTPPSLNDFTYSGSGPSDPQTIFISGINLTDNVVVTAPQNFEVCRTAEDTFTDILTLAVTDGTLDNTSVYVRMTENLDVGNYSGNLMVNCGTLSESVTLSGSVSALSVETPTFSPVGGTYTDSLTVVISCATDGATIHYTLDGLSLIYI